MEIRERRIGQGLCSQETIGMVNNIVFSNPREQFHNVIRLPREPQWSSDEKICAMLVNTHVVFYENADFSKIVHKINIGNVAKFSVAPGNAPYHILCNMPGNSTPFPSSS